MKKIYTYFLAFLLLALSQNLIAQTYVNASAVGANDGSSWADAYTDLEVAINNTGSSDIWVAEGIYTPGSGLIDTLSSFVISSSISLYGGFIGTETNLEDRNPETNLTILSGDLAGDDIVGNFELNRTDNTKHVVTVQTTSVATIIDGFTISGGHTIDDNSNDFLRRGGGIYAAGQIMVNDCNFTNNFGNGGASIYIHETGPAGSEITNSTFFQNMATSQCAGILTIGANDISISDCEFLNNTTNRGCVYTNNSSDVTIEDCDFMNNSGDGWGNGYFNWQSQSITLKDCDFIGNQSINGGAIYMDGRNLNSMDPTDLFIDGCSFSGNMVTSTDGGNGGAIYVFRGSMTIQDTEFSNHTIGGSGGHCFFTGADKMINIFNTTFESATTSGWGGAHANYGLNSFYNIDGCTYEGNSNQELGGAVNCGFTSISTFSNCLFEGNSAGTAGGAISTQNDSTEVHVVNCEFISNSSSSNGGAISGANGSTIWTVTNSEFIANMSSAQGGAIHFNESGDDDISTLLLKNCQLIFNSAESQGGGLNIVDADATIENNVFYSNFAINPGTGGAVSTNSGIGNDVAISMTNNTFVNNSGAFAPGIAQWVEDETATLELTLQNNILQNDGMNYVIENGEPSVVSNGGNFDHNSSMTTELNNAADIFNGDAMLLDPDNLDFNLSPGSPCIDAGVDAGAPELDLFGNPRIGTTDIGAIEFGVDATEEIVKNNGALKVFPNPIGDNLNFTLENNWNGNLRIRIVDASGKEVFGAAYPKNNEKIQANFPVKSLISGNYFLTVSDGKKMIVEQISK